MAYIYRHIRLDKNVPFYIGVGADGKGDYKRARAKDGRNKIWKDIVKKTGYVVEIMIDDISFEEARNKEIEFIKIYGKLIEGGLLCNLTDGGEGWLGLKHTNETKSRISNKKKGNSPAPNKGKPSPIAKEKHPMWGKTHSDELKAKWRITRKGVEPWNKGIITSVPHLNVIQEAKKITVLQYNMNGEFISEHESINAAGVAGNISKGCISLCAQDKRKSAGGYIWKIKKVAISDDLTKITQ